MKYHANRPRAIPVSSTLSPEPFARIEVPVPYHADRFLTGAARMIARIETPDVRR